MDADRRALNRLPRWWLGALGALPALVLAVFYAWPVGTLLGTVVNRHSVPAALRVPGLGRIVWFTAWQAVVSTVLTMVIGLVPAYVLARFRFPGRAVVLALVTVPFMLPTVVVGAAFIALLPDTLHGTALAVIMAHVFFNVAVVVRLVGAMWRTVPQDLTGAARTLGASPAQVARHVVLPLLRPAMWAAATVVFAFTFTSFGVVQLLGGPAHPTIEVEIARRATQLGDVDGAAVLSVMQLLVLAVVVGLAARWQRRAAVGLRGGVQPRRVRTNHERATVVVTVALLIVALGAPLAALVRRSFVVGRGSLSLQAWRGLGRREVRPGAGLGVDPLASLYTSLRFALAATIISVVVGGVAALAIAAAGRKGRILDIGVMLPLGTSAVTIGLGMLITFDVAPVDWRARWWLIPVGHALVAIPFVVRAVVPVLRAIPAEQRDAAATLGASPLRSWWSIDVRALWGPLATGAGFAAAISLGEFGATTFLTRRGRETVPIAIARLLGRVGDLPQAEAFALAVILMVATGVVIIAIEGRRGGSADA